MPSTLTFEHYEVMTRDDGSLCELGRGAMGITYKGFDTRLRVPVALKVINAAHLHSDTARQRFVREAQSAARLRHRNVASVFHLGQEADNYFYAMEFIDGETVDSRVKKQGPLAPALALKIAAQVARALNAAQTHELVHRDIKPANLMLVHEDDELIVKVIDFGLAKVALGGGGEDAATLTMSGFLGTPHFASPEQLEEREIDVRSDIYSLGVTLWFALTGKTPFAGSVMQVMSQHITRQPPFELLENVPKPVVELLRGMLDKNPAQRPQTAIELRREIEQCLKQIGETDETPLEEPPAKMGETPTVSESDETQFETGAAIGTRFVITEHVGETEAGRVFRAHDNLENRDVRLLALDQDLMADREAMAQIEEDATKLVALAHPNVLGLYGVTNDGRSAYLTLEWIEGFSFRDLLRARRELCLAELLRLLPQAAAGIDATASVQSDRLTVTLQQLSVNFPEGQVGSQNLLHRTVETWPEFGVKFNALPISRDRFSLTWDGGQTIVGKKRGQNGEGAGGEARIVQEFATVVYEMLGGTPELVGPRRYTPLGSLDETGNSILRRAILTPESFASATDFVHAFNAPPEALPLPPIRSAAAETTTPEAPLTEIRETPKIVEPAAIVEKVIEPPAEAAVEPVPDKAAEAPPPPEAAVLPAPMPVEELREPSSKLPYATAAAVLLLAGAAYFSRDHWRHPIAKNVPLANPTPVIVVPEPTPKPTPLPTPAPPTRMELANNKRKAAEALEAKLATREALIAWLALAKDYPEFKPGKVGLELLIDRLRNRPGGLPATEFAAIRDEVTQAAKLDVLAAMMLLGEQLRVSDPPTALEWFSAAAEKGDAVAMTKAALLLSNGVGPASDPEKVVHYLEGAAEKKEPNAMLALGQLYLSGGFGVKQDKKRAIELLQASADLGNTRAKNELGNCHHKGDGVVRNDKEAFRLFTEAAAGGNAEAIGNLGVLWWSGDGVPKKDLTKAAGLFKQAGEKGDVESMYAYAQCLQNGRGVPENRAEAKRWFHDAAARGQHDALEWCKTNMVPVETQKPETPER